MDEQALNLSTRKFLKKVGVSSQREIERAVDAALESGAARGKAAFPVKMTLEMPDLRLNVTFDGEIRLEGSVEPES